MKYKQKLTKIGNSVGVIIPKEIRDAFVIGAGTEVFLEPSKVDRSIAINIESPGNKIDPKFFELVKSIDNQYSQALKQLASK